MDRFEPADILLYERESNLITFTFTRNRPFLSSKIKSNPEEIEERKKRKKVT